MLLDSLNADNVKLKIDVFIPNYFKSFVYFSSIIFLLLVFISCEYSSMSLFLVYSSVWFKLS
jgi:hypothetical protein